MARPLIAVTADRRALGPKPASQRIRPARPEVFVHEAIVRAIRAAGGDPLLVPPDEHPDPEFLERLLRLAGGLVLTGGPVDLHPRHYGQEVLGRLDGVDEGRAALELGLARLALARGVPVLGICGGMQTLAVAAGGRLWQDILTLVPGGGEHEQPTDPAEPWHAVELRGDEARALFGAAQIQVNSTHHQAVSDPGALTVVGWAPDGVAEVVRHPAHPHAWGVQWHPETLAPQAGVDVWAPYRGLVRAAEKKFSAPYAAHPET